MRNLSEISETDILGGTPDEEGEVKGVRSSVLSFIRQNPDGTTVALVSKAIGISEARARALLQELCREREIYDRRVPGIKNILYYPNGRLIHKYLQESREFGSQIFRISFHEGRRTPRIQIQERSFSLIEGEKVAGSIFVDSDNAERLVDMMKELMDRFEDYKSLKT